MPIVGKFDISDSINGILNSIPGPQEGESVTEYKSRVNTSIATIVSAAGIKLDNVSDLVKRTYDRELDETDQFYSATERRFVG